MAKPKARRQMGRPRKRDRLAATFSVAFLPEIIAKLDEVVAADRLPSRGEAVRRMVEDALRERGLL